MADDEDPVIADAIAKQLQHGRYPVTDTYGDGHAGERIADTLAKLGPVEVQKLITY